MSRNVPESSAFRTPIWVWLLITLFALIEPAQHAWLRLNPPEGAAHTGLHIPDDAIFLQAMRMFDTGYYSPYASCKAASDSSPAYFALPYLWFYGIAGLAGRAVGLDDFTTLGLLNGAGGFVYLLVVFRFLTEFAPQYAQRAFAIFTLGGGLGGMAYAGSAMFGMHLWQGFEDYFRRFALYELLEGPYLSPLACLPRVYYTLALALALGGMIAQVRAVRMRCAQHLGLAILLYGAATLLNLRVGAFVSGIAALYVLCAGMCWRTRAKQLAAIVAPVALVGAGVVMVMKSSPIMIANHENSGAMATWLSPFLTASIFILCPALYQVVAGLCFMNRSPRIITLVALGYLAAFCLLFAAYQAYYGNILICRDGVVAVAISDWALLGALVGGLLGRFVIRAGVPNHPNEWMVIWFVAFLALSVSAFGHGWFLQFGPQRLLVLIGLPMSVLATQALESARVTRPRRAAIAQGLIMGGGVASILVSFTCFQGAAAWWPDGPFSWARPGMVTRADRQAMDRTPYGRILAPALAADVLGLDPKHKVVFGIGSFNLTEQPFAVLESGVNAFFANGASEEFRRRFVNEWRVDYVYCSDTWRVNPAVIEQLRRTPWLRLHYASGMATVFAVTPDPDSRPRHAN